MTIFLYLKELAECCDELLVDLLNLPKYVFHCEVLLRVWAQSARKYLGVGQGETRTFRKDCVGSGLVDKSIFLRLRRFRTFWVASSMLYPLESVQLVWTWFFYFRVDASLAVLQMQEEAMVFPMMQCLFDLSLTISVDLGRSFPETSTEGQSLVFVAWSFDNAV